MKVLVFDIAGTTGFAEFDSENPTMPVSYGVLKLDKPAKSYAKHPWGYVYAAQDLASKMVAKVLETRPERIVVEETNGARSRFTQKFLEYCHLALLLQLSSENVVVTSQYRADVVYVNTSDWRRKMDVHLTPADKRQNARLSRNKRKAAERGTKLDKKALGIKGRVTIKHVSVRVCNEIFGLGLCAKDDDIADAMLLGAAYLRGVPVCEGQE